MSESNLQSPKIPEPPRRIVPVALVPVVVVGIMGLIYVVGRDAGRARPPAPPGDAPPGSMTRAEARSLERPLGPLTGLKPMSVRPLPPGRIPPPMAPFAPPPPTGTAVPAKAPPAAPPETGTVTPPAAGG